MNAEIFITGDGSPTLFIRDTGETYHSRHGALTESMHVFIEHGLKYVRQSGNHKIHVFELGFGTGLNAALTMLKSAEWNQTIVYHTLECNPPSESLVRSYSEYYAPDIREALLAVNSAPWNERVQIGSYFSITKQNIDFHSWQPHKHYQVIYYDAFSPASAPHLWTADCFTKLASAMPTGAALVTFCAKGEVKRTMRGCGFSVERLPGAPGKLEMTRAIRL